MFFYFTSSISILNSFSIKNKGKSTILKKLISFDLLTGNSIKTEGLSIKYPEIKGHPNLKIVLLDSEWIEAPILKFDNYNANIENSKKNILKMQKINY